MGACGYGPLDADCCCDSVFESMRKAEKQAYKMLKNPRKYEEEDVRGLCHFIYVVQKEGFYAWEDEDKLKETCITLLKQLLEDSEYINDWNEPTRIRTALRQQIRQLERAFS